MRRFLIILALIATGCSPSSEPSTTVATTSPAGTSAGGLAAPEFPDGLDWINTDSPIRLADLTGKIVLLDFWTYGCINCIHIIPDLKRLEEEYASELVVIGVHSAKFSNESDTANIREVVKRYEIEHPVVNDRDFAVWQAWGAQAWPTIALIDPAGNVVGSHAGEGVYDVAQPVIEGLLEDFAGEIDRVPFVATPEADATGNTVLSYPGKVTIGSGLLYVADTGHHRVVAALPDTGEIVAVYGNGRSGFSNGSALEAQFDSPQGLVFDATTGTLYVADTNNHAIRTVDVATGQVSTLAGTGQLGSPSASALLEDARLNSPWGLALRDRDLWIAMAGSHQIWLADLDGGFISPTVGSGSEGVINGPIAHAALAQPSGLVFDADGRLYFTDSESSSIRWADVADSQGETGTLSGSDVNLFDFGDEDGIGTAARLQHPLGITWDPATGDLIVADTYNNKLKRIDPATGETVTLLGEGAGWADGPDAQFYEPGGVVADGGLVYVADTNNHVIRVVDLAAATAATLVLHGIENFTPPPDDADYPGTIVDLEAVTLAPGSGQLTLDIGLPEGYKVNPDAPSAVDFVVTEDVVALSSTVDLTGTSLPVAVPLEIQSGTGEIIADLTLLYCRADSEGLCIIEQVRFRQPVSVAAGASTELVWPYEVQLPDF